jgi:PilZ domain
MVIRKHPRFPVSLSSTLVHKDHFRYAGSVRNLSVKGCRIDSIISPFTGMQLTVQLDVPGESKPIVIYNAAVRWSGSSGIGLEFLTVAPPHQARLDLMIQRLQPKTSQQ